jgi:hypothetical protein
MGVPLKTENEERFDSVSRHLTKNKKTRAAAKPTAPFISPPRLTDSQKVINSVPCFRRNDGKKPFSTTYGTCKSGPSLYSPFHVKFSLGSRESLDRVAQHGPRHLPAVFFQKGFLRDLVPFPHLPQHPTDRFPDEILFVSEENFADSQCVIELLLFDKSKSRQDRNSPFPQHGRTGEPVKRFPAPVH